MTEKNVLSALSLFLVMTGLAFAYSLWGRAINVDDAWLGEPTFWLAKEGVLRSEILRGWVGAEEKLYFFHKLFALTGSWVVSLFGYGVYQLKSLSLFYYVLFIVSWIWFFNKEKLSKTSLLIFLSILTVNSFFFEYSFIYRPELALAFFAFWSCYFLTVESEKTNWLFILLAGFSAALGIGNHLNGMVIAGGGCVLLLWQRRFWPFWVFGIVSSLGFLFYLLQIDQASDLLLMKAQFFGTQDMRDAKGLIGYLFGIVDEQRRYLHSPREASMTLLFLMAAVFGYRSLEKYRPMMVFMFGMMFCLAVISHGKTSKYLVLHLGFMIFFSALFVAQSYHSHRRKILVVVFFYLGFQGARDWVTMIEKDNHAEVLSQLAGDLPVGTHLLGPMEGAFWAWGRYRYQSIQVYDIAQMSGASEEGRQRILDKLKESGIQYLILPKSTEDLWGISGDVFGEFKLVKPNEEHQLKLFSLQ